MTTRRLYGLGAVLLTAGLLGACSSQGATGGSSTAQQPGATEVLPPDATVTSGATPTADDLCTVIPDLATIEAAIGVPVKDPMGIGIAGSQQTCMLLRATDDFPGITFMLTALVQLGSRRSSSRYSQTSVVSSPNAPYHSMPLGQPALAPAR
jgi:hypothetical protein